MFKVEHIGVCDVVGQNELNCIAIGHPDKTLSKNHVAAFVDGVIPGKSLAKMRMKPDFVVAGLPCTKANGMENSGRAFCHEGESVSIPIVLHCFELCFVSGWLA